VKATPADDPARGEPGCGGTHAPRGIAMPLYMGEAVPKGFPQPVRVHSVRL
jgi:hypothetical protein